MSSASDHKPSPAPAATAARAITSGTFTGSPLGKLAQIGIRPWIVLMEAAVLPAFMLALGLWLNPEDPLWIHADFHWAWLAPMVVALAVRVSPEDFLKVPLPSWGSLLYSVRLPVP